LERSLLVPEVNPGAVEPLGGVLLRSCGYKANGDSPIVRAHGELTAIQVTRDLGICPLEPDAYIPNDVMCTPLNWRDMKRIPTDLRNRLLSEAEMRSRLDGKRVDE
jgi:hypothetical protein